MKCKLCEEEPYHHNYCKKHWADYMRSKKYGFESIEVFNEYLDSVDTCPICEKPFNKKKRKCIDHCHKNGHVRGVLCDGCNTMLGKVNDDEQTLLNAIKYLHNTNQNEKNEQHESSKRDLNWVFNSDWNNIILRGIGGVIAMILRMIQWWSSIIAIVDFIKTI